MNYIIPLEDFLFESKRTAKENFLDKGLISEETFNEFLGIDTTPTKKFIDTMCMCYSQGSEVEEIIQTFQQAIPLFTKGIIKVDIKSIKSLDELKGLVEEKSSHKSRSVIRDEMKSDATLIYEDENFKIIRPTTSKSCKIYGRGTKWCISAKEDVKGEMFNRYTNDGINHIYMILSKKLDVDNPLYKVAVVVSPYGIQSTWDSKDVQIPFRETMVTLGLDVKLFKYVGLVPNGEIQKEVEYVLNGMNYTIKDYKLGIAYQIDNPKREIRIGKLLNKYVGEVPKLYGYSQTAGTILSRFNSDIDRIN